MDWTHRYGSVLAIMAALAGGFLWMNSKFNAIEKDVAIIKTVMIMKEIMPRELAVETK